MVDEADLWREVDRREQFWNITGWVVFDPDDGRIVARSDRPVKGVAKVARLDMP